MLKFGAFCPCHECDRRPTERDDVIRSLALTDHYFTHDQLADFGTQIQNGDELEIDPELESQLSHEIDDDALQPLARMSDPAVREYYRKRERNIILVTMAILLAVIGWVIYRFAVGYQTVDRIRNALAGSRGSITAIPGPVTLIASPGEKAHGSSCCINGRCVPSWESFCERARPCERGGV